MRTRARAAIVAVALLFAALSASAATAERAGGPAITPEEARTWKPAMKAARAYAQRRAGHITFAVLDMKGRSHRHKAFDKLPMASTFKVMLMVAYLRQDSVKRRDLEKWEKRLIRPMIRKSANDPATRIRDMLGRGPIEALAKRAKMRRFEWNSIWGYCRSAARDQALFMRNLERHVPARHWPFARRQLRNIVRHQRWGIGQVSTPGWQAFFKGGWGSGSGAVEHQVALVSRAKRRIGLAVMTTGSPSHSYAKATLEGVFKRLLHGLPR